MEFHPDKCCVLTASRSKSISSHQYTLHGHTLKDVTTTSYTSVTLQGNARFNLRINNVQGKANKKINKLEAVQRRAVRFALDRHHKTASVDLMLQEHWRAADGPHGSPCCTRSTVAWPK